MSLPLVHSIEKRCNKMQSGGHLFSWCDTGISLENLELVYTKSSKMNINKLIESRVLCWMDERHTLVCEDSFSLYAIQHMGPKRSLVFLSWTLTFDWYVVP